MSMFYDVYTSAVYEALGKIERHSIEKARDVIYNAAVVGMPLYVFGNGGSASLSEHFSCDHTKGVRHDTDLRPNVVSLASNMALVTAIANDYSYDEVFSKQLEAFPDHGVAIAITASGNSPNVVKGLRKASEKGMTTICFVGFEGGYVMDYEAADHFVYVPSSNYGIVEDCHQIIMHAIAQEIRSKYHHKRTEIRL